MLGKLLKYEIKATGRIFLPAYLALLVVAVISSFTLQSGSSIVNALTGFLLFLLYGAVIAITIVLLIQRFYRNLLSDEGYLMFTLPVRPSSLIMSKLITSCIWCLSSMIVGVAAGLIAGRRFFSCKELADVINTVKLFFAGNSISPLLILLGMVVLLSQFIQFVTQIYISLAIGQLPPFSKHRILFSIIAYIVISIAVQTVLSVIGFAASSSFALFFSTGPALSVADTATAVSGILWAALAVNLVIAAAEFVGTSWILRKKLNIE